MVKSQKRCSRTQPRSFIVPDPVIYALLPPLCSFKIAFIIVFTSPVKERLAKIVAGQIIDIDACIGGDSFRNTRAQWIGAQLDFLQCAFSNLDSTGEFFLTDSDRFTQRNKNMAAG